jgi:hypothetical protein
MCGQPRALQEQGIDLIPKIIDFPSGMLRKRLVSLRCVQGQYLEQHELKNSVFAHDGEYHPSYYARPLGVHL